ncbi:hypothetical protein GPECTOR_48g434 [Gonium pectorale]|uniref:Peptidase M11 gametolysin domain-containing protein n=1 Tax=Gonium pectorale TaxID=33097 RepID=A0A150G836_GONPE|nr:hypothetical protein GPECTOR_48g434 [Gonium pectorale]|eukprot:KXZ46002.1 hypothetical protein GPECTOR_48g434 [Gonium pectorale]
MVMTATLIRTSAYVIGAEVGMADFGLSHAYSGGLNPDTGGGAGTDPSSPLGDFSKGGASCPTAPELYYLKWAAPLATLDSYSLEVGEGNYHVIRQFVLPAQHSDRVSGSNGSFLLIKPTWMREAGGTSLFIALRQREGRDADLNPDMDNKVSVHIQIPAVEGGFLSSFDAAIEPNSVHVMDAYRVVIQTGGTALSYDAGPFCLSSDPAASWVLSCPGNMLISGLGWAYLGVGSCTDANNSPVCTSDAFLQRATAECLGQGFCRLPDPRAIDRNSSGVSGSGSTQQQPQAVLDTCRTRPYTWMQVSYSCSQAVRSIGPVCLNASDSSGGQMDVWCPRGMAISWIDRAILGTLKAGKACSASLAAAGDGSSRRALVVAKLLQDTDCNASRFGSTLWNECVGYEWCSLRPADAGDVCPGAVKWMAVEVRL